MSVYISEHWKKVKSTIVHKLMYHALHAYPAY